MSGHLFDRYGAILNEDVEVLEECLETSWFRHRWNGPVRVLEIGMHDGGTARGIENWAKAAEFNLEYIGIDPDDGTKRPRYVPKGGKVIIGDSAEVFNQVPDDIDLVWVDGCHCRNHIILDTFHYAPKVRVGGFICFHDVNPACQGWGHQYHGPDSPEFSVDVVAALKLIRFPWEGWSFFKEGIPDPKENIDCGTRAYRRDG